MIKFNQSRMRLETETGNSIYYKYFRGYFDFFLEDMPPVDDSYEYVDVPGLSDELTDEILKANRSKIVFLLGYAGIGKTTLMKKFFGIGKYSKEKSGDIKNIVLYFSCRGQIGRNVKELLKGVVSSACVRLQKTHAASFPAIMEEPNDPEFIEYIDKIRSDALERYSERKSSDEEKLQLLFKHDPLAYHALFLKYLITKYLATTIENIIIIFDDIEMLPTNEERGDYLHSVHYLYDCLRNIETTTHTKLLISERQYTYREFRSLNWVSGGKIIHYLTPVDILKLFENRLQWMIKKTEDGAVSRSSWQTSFEFLKQVIKINFIENHENLLLSLCNYNLRDTLNLIDKMLMHGTWYQKTTGSSAIHFRHINGETIFLDSSLSRILKSIAYGQEWCYFESRDYYKGLTNIMRWYPDVASRPLCYLVTPLAIKWMLAHASLTKENNEEEFFTFQNCLDSFDQVFHYESASVVKDALQKTFKHLYEQGFVDVRFTGKANGKVRDVTDESIEYHFMPRGDIHWGLLAEASVLLEILLEDIDFDENDVLYKEIAQARSPHCSPDDSQLRKMLVALDYTRRVSDCEKELIDKYLLIEDSKIPFRQKFGSETIAWQMLKGIKKSIQKLYQGNPPRILSDREEAMSSIVREYPNS